MDKHEFIIPVDDKIIKNPIPDQDYLPLIRTFSRFADIGSSSDPNASDFLLLLTSCRNEWYWLNSLHAELRLWLYGYLKYHSMHDALMALEINKRDTRKSIGKAIHKARRLCEDSKGYLAQYERKYELFMKNFRNRTMQLQALAKRLWPGREGGLFLREYASSTYDEGELAHYSGETSPEGEYWLEQLEHVYQAQKAYTTYFESYLSRWSGTAIQSAATIELAQRELVDQLNSMKAVNQKWSASVNEYEVMNSLDRIPMMEFVVEFQKYMERVFHLIKRYARSKLPNEPYDSIDSTGSDCRALLWIVPIEKRVTRISIDGQKYKIEGNKAILLFDINNSAKAESKAPQLKQDIDLIITQMTDDIVPDINAQHALKSMFTWDDYRVMVFDEVDDAIQAAEKISHWVDTPKYIQQDGITGLRFGLSIGSVIVGCPDWRVKFSEAKFGDHPALGNVIARAARLLSVWGAKLDMIDPGHSIKECKRDFGMFISSNAIPRTTIYREKVIGPVSAIVKSFGNVEAYWLNVSSHE